jgi:hypothetical protein
MENMIGDTFQDYWLAIDSIEASQQLNLINVACYTSMKKSDREKFYKSLNKKCKSIFIEKDKAVLSIEEFAKRIAENMKYG